MSKRSKPKDTHLNHLLTEYLTNLSNTNSVLELEVRFGTKGKMIKKIDFDNVAQKLYAVGFVPIHKEKHTLKISSEFVDNDGNNRYSNIRTEINDLYHISDYCKTNNLSGSELFLQKYKYRIGNPPQNPIDNLDFQFRISLQEEKTFRKDSNVVQALIKSWKDSKKSFRLLNRTSLQHPDMPFTVDLSVVKSSRKEAGSYIMTYSLLESNLFHNREFYEIEIEIDNQKINEGTYTVLQLESMLKKMIKYILSGLQQTNYPISRTEQEVVLQQYYKLIHGKDNPKYVFKPGDFIGPSSYTLQKINMIRDEKTLTPNIHDNYCVTDKADGLRKLCFINEHGKLYFIDMLMNVQFTGTKTKDSSLFNTLFDGEHILHDKRKKYINLYACFDIYFLKGVDLRADVFIDETKMETKTVMRLRECITAVQDLYSLVSVVPTKPGEINKPSLRIITKKFYVASPSEPIYKCCKTLFDLMGIETEKQELEEGKESVFEYNTDGIIFTPTLLGVGCNSEGNKPVNYKKTWDYSFKWKPPEHNTIDFLIATKKNELDEDYIGNIFTDGIRTKDNLIQYKSLLLKVGFDESKHGYLNPLATLMNGEGVSEENVGKKGFYKPVLFYPTSPFDTNAHISHVLLRNDTNGTPQMFSTEGEIIEDNMIVEFKYDLEKSGQWRWVPIKVRYDKTAEFRNGNKNYGNAYHVANSNWQSIHNPITPIMLSTNTVITVVDDDVYYARVSGESKTRGLRDFHNLFVKRLVINIVSNAGDMLIDYAVGKGGDFSKWKRGRIGFVLGIDISRDNIENKIDGACARYLNQKKKFQTIPKAMFLHGDTSKLIENGDAFYSDTSKSVIQALLGEGEKDKRTLGNGVFQLFGIAAPRFHISSIQFALHYMFETKLTLHRFLKNVSDFTRVGGFFVGTCFNGKEIFDMLKSLKYGMEKSIMIEDTKIWAIKKQYHSSDFQSNEKCVGYEIDIYQETINKYTREYLVHFDYLTQILADYGFTPLAPEECKTKGLKTSIGTFKDLYHIMEASERPDYGEALKMTLEEKEVSFLNQYFIYKKTHNVDTKEIFKMYTDGAIDEPVPFTIGKARKLKERLTLHA